MITRNYLVSNNNIVNVNLNDKVNKPKNLEELVNKSVCNITRYYPNIATAKADECVGFKYNKTKQTINIVSPTMEKNLNNNKIKPMTVIAIYEDSTKPGTREGYLVANELGDISAINVNYVKKAKKEGYLFTNMSAEKGFLVAFDGVNIPIIKIDKEEKKKTFKFYGFDTMTQSILKLTKKDCEASVIINSKNVLFNLLDETQKLIKKPDSLFFKTIKKQNDCICVELVDNVAKTDPQLDNVSCFVGGMGLNSITALKLIKMNLNVSIKANKPVITTDYNKMSTFQLCLAFKSKCNDIAKRKKAVDEASNILKQVCDNGEVFTKGNKRVAILLGTEEGNKKFDGKAFSAAFPEKVGEYRKYGERKDDVIVDDGVSEKRVIDKTTERNAEGKKIYKRENFTNDQLFDMAFGLNETKELLVANEYKKTDMENILVNKLNQETPTSESKLEGKLPGTMKTFTITDCGNKILVTLKHYEHGPEGWDLDRLKFEGTYEDFVVRNKNSVFLTVLNII